MIKAEWTNKDALDLQPTFNQLETDCISRQAAIDAIENVSCFDGKGISALKCEAIDDAVRTIRKLPTAQPEIVKCKDCKHRDAEIGFCEGRGWPMQLVPDDGFCDKGYRRASDE